MLSVQMLQFWRVEGHNFYNFCVLGSDILKRRNNSHNKTIFDISTGVHCVSI